MKIAKPQKGLCLICEDKITKLYDGRSPEPILPDSLGRCCEGCYAKLILPIRQLRSKYAVSTGSN